MVYLHFFYDPDAIHSLLLPVTIISAKWRMYAQRKRYRNLRWAATLFATHWKRLTVQRYVRRYKAAVIVVRRFISGFMHRHKPKCPENIYVSAVRR